MDEQLQQTVTAQLAADPRIDHSAIAVSADLGGTVTLQGTIGSLRQKIVAGHDAEHVKGVRKVDNQLEVRILDADRRADADLRGAVLQALRLDSLIPSSVDATVDQGVVTLTGRASWKYERDEAEFVAGNIMGVTGLRSEIVLEPTPTDTDIVQSIQEAFYRDAILDPAMLVVSNDEGVVTIAGVVSSWTAHDAALEDVWATPGVVEVYDQLDIR